MTILEIRRYQTSTGTVPLTQWLDSLRDGQARARIVARLDRLQVGLFGDWKGVGAGVCELRIHHGPGYRVYYGLGGTTLVLLLCGGDKSTQIKDIENAHACWKDYKTRSGPKPPVQGSVTSAKRSRNRRLR
jgi:putative addiction module killer protein